MRISWVCWLQQTSLTDELKGEQTDWSTVPAAHTILPLIGTQVCESHNLAP